MTTTASTRTMPSLEESSSPEVGRVVREIASSFLYDWL